MNTVSVQRVDVGDASIQALVKVDAANLRTSSAQGIAERALEILPGLARHSCQNDADRPFSAELRDTETAHLLEHVVCELMALAGSGRSLRAQTAWDFKRDGTGVFRVAYEYDDDLVAMAALKHAAEVVDWLFEGGAPPDIAARVVEIGRLRHRSTLTTAAADRGAD